MYMYYIYIYIQYIYNILFLYIHALYYIYILMFNSWFHRPNKVIIAFSVCRSSPWIVDRWGLPCWARWVDVLGFFLVKPTPKKLGKKHQTWDRNGRIAKNHEITRGNSFFFEVYGDFRQNVVPFPSLRHTFLTDTLSCLSPWRSQGGCPIHPHLFG